MKRIIITAILTVICAVGAGTSFAVNDLPNFGEWMKTNEQQFKKPPKHDGPDKHMDKQHMKDNNQKMPQDGMGPNNGNHMHQDGQMPAPAAPSVPRAPASYTSRASAKSSCELPVRRPRANHKPGCIH